MSKFSFKIFAVFLTVVVIGFSVVMCLKKPQLHKPLQVNVIEYILKINTDGSVTTTKSVTTNVVKEK